MTRKSTITLAALALRVAPASAFAAEKSAAPVEHKTRYALDRTQTSSIDGASRLTNCDPTAPDATLVCRITRGDPNATFPSAPGSAIFGF